MLPTLAFLLALVENDPIKLAESHYEAGRSAYERGAWDVALIEFEAAFQLSHEPDLIYNLSKTAEAAGMLAESLRYARSYLAAKGASIAPKDADEVNGRIARLDALLHPPVSNTPLPEATILQAPIPKERSHEPSIGPAPVALIITGGALAIGGIGCLGAAWRTSQELQAPELTFQTGADLDARGRALNAAGIALTITGSTVAVAGTAWAVKRSGHR